MRKLMGVLAAVLIMGSSSAFAITNDFSISAGMKSWYNWYEPPSYKTNSGKEISKSSAAFMIGPTIKAQYKNMFIGVSYLLTTNDYEPASGSDTFSGVNYELTSNVSRNDLDVVVGYQLSPRFSVTTGYKGIFLDSEDKLTFPINPNVSGTVKQDSTLNLGALGASGNIPLTERIILLLNGNALVGDYQNEISYIIVPASIGTLSNVSENKTAWGGSVETGAAYRIIKNMSANLGFKYQYLKVGSEGVHFYGPTFGLDYRF